MWGSTGNGSLTTSSVVNSVFFPSLAPLTSTAHGEFLPMNWCTGFLFSPLEQSARSRSAHKGTFASIWMSNFFIEKADDKEGCLMLPC